MSVSMKRRWTGVVLLGCMMAVAGLAVAATGEVAAASSPPASTVDAGTGIVAGLTWEEILQYGGWLMYVLAGLSLLTLSLVIYFLAVLRVGQIAPRSLQRELVDKLRSGNVEDARRTCEYRRGPLAAVTLAGISYLNNVQDLDPMLLKDVMEGEGSRQAESIQGQTQYLLDMAAVAPMVGLLGTVFGMLKAFGSVARDIASAQPVVLAAGVSQALITTAFGLIIGIPSMMFYAVFRRKASKLVAHLESASVDVLTALLSGRRTRSPVTSSRPAPTNSHVATTTQAIPTRSRTVPAKTFEDIQ